MHYCILLSDRPKAAEPGGADRGNAFDRPDSTALVTCGQSRQFQLDDRLLQRCLVGHRAEHFIFPRSFFMLSKAIAPLDRSLRKLCNLAHRRIYPPMAA